MKSRDFTTGLYLLVCLCMVCVLILALSGIPSKVSSSIASQYNSYLEDNSTVESGEE